MKYSVVKYGVPNKNGRIYSKEIVEDMVTIINRRPIPIYVDDKQYFGDEIGLVKDPEIIGNELYVDLDIMKSHPNIDIQNILKLLEKKEIVPVINGIGELDEDYNVKNYTLVSINLVPADMAS
ncbi:hypothetical protein M0R36_10570 [bacterium]|jgi:hypothetical protein|nr:hypothetical protein [bacterium]